MELNSWLGKVALLLFMQLKIRQKYIGTFYSLESTKVIT